MKEKPMILMLKTLLGYYFYEANRNEIVWVNKELYEYIEMLYFGKGSTIVEISERTKKEYQELLENGYLLPSRVEKIEHALTNEVEKLLERKVDKITLQAHRFMGLLIGEIVCLIV